MDNAQFKESLLKLITDDIDEVDRVELVEVITTGYKDLQESAELYKQKYDELQTKYIEAFVEGIDVEDVVVEDDVPVVDEIDEETARAEEIGYDDLFEGDEKDE